MGKSQASVPNWLREEIIKNKSAITTSSLEHPKEETESIEDEAVDKSLGKADQADSKSIDSSKSTEEEDDDEVFFAYFLCLFHISSVGIFLSWMSSIHWLSRQVHDFLESIPWLVDELPFRVCVKLNCYFISI